MNEIIKKLFKEFEFKNSVATDDYCFFEKENNQYYFTLELNISEIIQIQSIAQFEINDKYLLLKKHFDALKNEDSNTIEKNTSLILFIKCESLNAIETTKQQILLIEEDEYFFKKYAVLYTENAIKKIDNTNEITKQLRNKVNVIENFDTYATNGISLELEEYVFIMQLFIKLPFLSLVYHAGGYSSLENKIQKGLGNDKLVFEYMLSKAEMIKNIDFENSDDSIIDEIISQIPKDND